MSERTANDRSRRSILQSLGMLGAGGFLGTVARGDSDGNGGVPGRGNNVSRPRPPQRDNVGPETSVETIVAGRTRESVTLNWGEPIDPPAYFSSGVSFYEVYVDGEQVEQLESPTGGRTPRSRPDPVYVSKTITGLEPGKSYLIRLVAVDEAGNRGEAVRIGAQTLPTTPGADTVPPTVPALGPTSERTKPFDELSTMELQWRASHDTQSAVDHYNLYLNGSKERTIPTKSTEDDDISLERGYVVMTLDELEPSAEQDLTLTAVDTAGNETSRTDPRARYRFRTRATDVRDCSSIEQTDAGTDVDLLRMDRSNGEYFPGPDGGGTDARITRNGTSDSASVVFDLGAEQKRLERGRLQYHVWRDEGTVRLYTREDGDDWERRRLTPETYARKAGWSSKTARFYNVGDELKVELRDGAHDWSVQLGQLGVNWVPSTSTVQRSAFDRKRDLFYSVRARGTDHRSSSESIVIDTSNVSYFERPDGSVHNTRVTRTTTDDAEIVYDQFFDETLESVSAEYHVHEDAGGTLEIYETTDDGDSWTAVDTARTSYGDADAGWQHYVTKAADFSGDATGFKLVFTGGEEPWGLQLGAVEY